MAQGLIDLSSALAFRLRDLARVLDRLDRLESGTGGWLASQQPEELAAAATEMTLRAVSLAANPTNYAILAFLAAQKTAPIGELEKATGLARLALAEHVNDLVQVGLAGRNIDTDQVQGTAAGQALADLLASISRATTSKLAEALQPVTR